MADLLSGTSITIHLDGDACWPDLTSKEHRHGKIVSVATLPDGTSGGRPSIMIRAELDDGSIVLIETTLRLFNACAAAFRGRYGDVE